MSYSRSWTCPVCDTTIETTGGRRSIQEGSEEHMLEFHSTDDCEGDSTCST